VDIPYATLDKDPVGELRRIYETLDLGGWEAFEPRLHAYLGTVANYEKNKPKPLPDPIRQRIQERWGVALERMGYVI
jgi:truncated hemoglobin YjbI